MELKYVRKDQNAIEETKNEDSKKDTDSYLYQDVEILEERPPPVGIPIKE